MHANASNLALVVLIVYLVLSKSKDRVMPVKKLLFLPGLSLYFLYDSLTTHFTLNTVDMVSVAGGLLVGAAIGYVVRMGALIKSDKEQMLLLVKGSWTAVVMFSIILFTKIGIGYFMQTRPDVGMQFTTVQLMLVLVASLASGLPVGQSLIYFIKFQKASSEYLAAPRK